jgi:transketolase
MSYSEPNKSLTEPNMSVGEPKLSYSELTKKSYSLRRDIADMVYRSKGGHLGGDFSVTDILVTLYYLHMDVSAADFGSAVRDRLILSKGHCVAALYAVLCDRGFFPKSDLETFCKFGSKYIGHPTNKVNGIEMNSGSLGHGLSVGVGMALAGKMGREAYRVYVVMGDGELAEGTVWEGAMAGSNYKLDNLVAVVDRNGLQISGETEEVMAQECLASRWAAFGWNVIEAANGNDIECLDKAFRKAKQCPGKPSVVIAHTVKGFGYSEAEGQVGWHHRVPTREQYEAIIKELSERGAAIR